MCVIPTQFLTLVYLFLIAALGTFDVHSYNKDTITRTTRVLTILSWLSLTLFIVIPVSKLHCSV